MDHPTPKYYAQKHRILELIEGARAGDPLPTERELAERFGTSRTTIRRALSELAIEGRVERAQGRGTFVARRPHLVVRPLTSFSEDLADGRLTSETVGISVEAAAPETASDLGIAPGDPVTRVERVRLRDGEPLAHENAALPGRYPGLAEELAAQGSLYATLHEGYRIEITAVDDEIAAEPASPAEARLLGVEPGQPLLVVQRTARSADGTPRERTRSAFRGDRFRFRSSAAR